MADARTATVLITFSALHSGDLETQAFARHVTQLLPEDAARNVIAGMRGFLEGRPELVPDIPLDDAETGADVVEILATGSGLASEQIAACRRSARESLIASAWAVSPAPGVDEILTAARNGHGGPAAQIVVLDEDAAGVDLVLRSWDLLLTTQNLPGVSGTGDLGPSSGPRWWDGQVRAAGGAGALLVVGTSWRKLSAAHAHGCRTALVDRFARGRGTPTWRAASLRELVPSLAGWMRTGPATRADVPTGSDGPAPREASA